LRPRPVRQGAAASNTVKAIGRREPYWLKAETSEDRNQEFKALLVSVFVLIDERPKFSAANYLSLPRRLPGSMIDPAMIKCKVCLMGAFAVGKTSLVRRFVSSIFSDSYHTTVGVKVDRKTVVVSGREATLLIWDIQGEDEVTTAPMEYVRGAAGFILVADGTRPATLDTAFAIRGRIQSGDPVPCVLLLNKSDLVGDWKITEQDISKMADAGCRVFRTSARTGAGVEEAFAHLAGRMLDSVDRGG
jgi:small GTP-binding protein